MVVNSLSNKTQFQFIIFSLNASLLFWIFAWVFVCILKMLAIMKQEFFIINFKEVWYPGTLFNIKGITPSQKNRRKCEISEGISWQKQWNYHHLLMDSLTFWDTYSSYIAEKMLLYHLELKNNNNFLKKILVGGNLLSCRKQYSFHSHLEFFDSSIYTDRSHFIFSIWSRVSYNFYYLFQS